MPNPELFRNAMRRFGSAVTVVATQYKGERRGLTATAVCSLSAEPPRLLVCVNQESSTGEMIRRSGAFSVNLLASEHERLSQVFSGAVSGAPKFSLGKWDVLCTGAPVLRGSVASFDCELAQEIDADTHSIFVGNVVDIAIGKSGRPLGYINRQYFCFPPLSREISASASDDSDCCELAIFP